MSLIHTYGRSLVHNNPVIYAHLHLHLSLLYNILQTIDTRIYIRNSVLFDIIVYRFSNQPFEIEAEIVCFKSARNCTNEFSKREQPIFLKFNSFSIFNHFRENTTRLWLNNRFFYGIEYFFVFLLKYKRHTRSLYTEYFVFIVKFLFF